MATKPFPFKSEFNFQPLFDAEIDPTSSFATSLTFAFNPNASGIVYNAVNELQGTSSAGTGSLPITTDSIGGRCRKYTSSSANEDFWVGISNSAGVKSFAVLVSWSAVPGLDGTFLKGGFNNGWGLKPNSSGQMRAVSASGSIVVTDPSTIVANKLYMFVGVFDLSIAYLYTNGFQVGNTVIGGGTGVGSTSGLNLAIGKDESVGTGSNANVYGAWVWDRVLSPDEVLSFSNNPWQLYLSKNRNYFSPAAGGGTTVSCLLGTMTDTGLSASIAISTNIAGTLATITDAGLTASITQGTQVNCSLGQITDAGLTASVLTATTVDCSLATLSDNGLAASVSVSTNIQGALGTITDAGLGASIYLDTGVNCSLGTILDSGLQAQILSANTIDCALATINDTGLSANISIATIIQCSTATDILNGLQAEIIYPIDINCSVGVMLDNGLTATITTTGQGPCMVILSDQAKYSLITQDQSKFNLSINDVIGRS